MGSILSGLRLLVLGCNIFSGHVIFGLIYVRVCCVCRNRGFCSLARVWVSRREYLNVLTNTTSLACDTKLALELTTFLRRIRGRRVL